MATPDIAVQLRSDEALNKGAELGRRMGKAPRLRRWTLEEYNRLFDAGILTTQDKVQLIEGEIVEMPSQNSPHATALSLAHLAILKIAGDNYYVRNQLPLPLDSKSEPQPDLAVVPGSPRDYRSAHPTTALLVVEVSESTLKFDRTKKARMYARAGIPDYWIINVDDRCVEVHRDPISGTPMHVEPCYQTVTSHGPGERISPLAMPNASIAVDDVLP
jgi:Uma2 family endonuclease